MSEVAPLLHSPGVFDPVPDRERLLLAGGFIGGELVEFDVPQQMRISAAANRVLPSPRLGPPFADIAQQRALGASEREPQEPLPVARALPS
jgi:hypothetical protein